MITANDFALTCALLMAAHWLYIIREGVLFERRSRKFLDEASLPLPTNPPMISILVPARNEEDGIAKCLNTLMAQDYPRFEVIAIDDRSTDRTGAIMDGCATAENEQSNGRLKVIHVDRLPEGWLGKNHALHLGSRAIADDSKYLLFTDGDVVFAPDTLTVSVRHCEANGIDHFVLSPLMLSNGPWLAAVQLVFGIGFLTYLRPSRLGKSKDVYVGIGAFNMVRRTFYEKCGGHERLRLEVIDDGMLGKILVAEGARADLVNGKRWLTLAWYHSVWGFVKGLEKNGFAALRYSIVRVCAFVLVNLWTYALPYVLIAISSGNVRSVVIGLVVFIHLCFAIAAVMMSMSPLLTLLLPFAAFVISFTFLRSTFFTLSRGGVTWRETKHPLAELKRNMI